MEWTIAMDNYPEKLVKAANEYLENHKDSELFHYDFHTSTPYKDKSITITNYRAYIVWGNLFEVLRFRICSNQEWNHNEVTSDSMIMWEIEMCYKKSGMFIIEKG